MLLARNPQAARALDRDGYSPLLLAIQENHHECVERIIEAPRMADRPSYHRLRSPPLPTTACRAAASGRCWPHTNTTIPPRSRRPDPEESVTLQVLVNSSNPDFDQEVVDRHMRRVEVDLRV